MNETVNEIINEWNSEWILVIIEQWLQWTWTLFHYPFQVSNHPSLGFLICLLSPFDPSILKPYLDLCSDSPILAARLFFPVQPCIVDAWIQIPTSPIDPLWRWFEFVYFYFHCVILMIVSSSSSFLLFHSQFRHRKERWMRKRIPPVRNGVRMSER